MEARVCGENERAAAGQPGAPTGGHGAAPDEACAGCGDGERETARAGGAHCGATACGGGTEERSCAGCPPAMAGTPWGEKVPAGCTPAAGTKLPCGESGCLCG
mmetsp:Transcript_65924/g.178228  ORF Transcript_65924/g.178228 Transcript_65924/m.178228 type:complete len:103 (+) Transcript_65924:395-703(+)